MEIQLFFSISILPSKGIKLWNFLDNFDLMGKIVAKFLLRKHFLSIYDNKTTLTMGAFKKYVTWIMIFFIPFACVTLCKLYFKTPCIIKNIKLWNERNEDFLYVWLLQHITLYIKGGRKLHKIALQSHFYWNYSII